MGTLYVVQADVYPVGVARNELGIGVAAARHLETRAATPEEEEYPRCAGVEWPDWAHIAKQEITGVKIEEEERIVSGDGTHGRDVTLTLRNGMEVHYFVTELECETEFKRGENVTVGWDEEGEICFAVRGEEGLDPDEYDWNVVRMY